MINSSKRHFRFSIVFAFILTSLLACGVGGSDDESNSIAAQKYIDDVLSIMRQYAITRHEIDWTALESEVKSRGANANSIRDTYPALLLALELLGTNHSFINTPSGQTLYHSGLTCREQINLAVPTLSDIGYLRVDGFSGTEAESIEYATSLQSMIAEQDNESIRGWIVDLRNNDGGNMWPMIAGIGPLLGEGTYGHFIDPDENISSWGYQAGSSIFNDTNVVGVDSPHELSTSTPRIAVLSSRRTASSGEATLISFKQQDNVRIFGTDSCGLSTANSMFELSDGGEFFLTVSTMADREMVSYGHSVEVDEEVIQDESINRAVEWITQ